MEDLNKKLVHSILDSIVESLENKLGALEERQNDNTNACVLSQLCVQYGYRLVDFCMFSLTQVKKASSKGNKGMLK